MRRILLTMVCLCTIVGISLADEVKPQRAKLVATNFCKQFTKVKECTNLKLIHTNKFTISSFSDNTKNKDTPLFYVFGASNKGFVTVSGTGNVTPIWGYSLHGDFSYSKMPPNFREFLKGYDKQIEYAIKNKVKAIERIQQRWAELEQEKPSFS